MYAAFRYSSPKAVLHLGRSFAVGDPELPRKIAVKSYAIFALTKYYKILCNSPPGIRWRLFLIMSKFPCSFRKFRIDIFTETWYNENVATG